MFKLGNRRWILWTVLGLIALLLPALLGSFWLQLGSLAFAAAIGAIGLMLLFGRVGQLSLGHPFFLAIGAYSYIWIASPAGKDDSWGLGWPSLVAIPIAVVVTALAGLLLSPLSSRVRGLSLGLATLSLIFIGIWLFYTLEPLTGGYNGRNAPALTIGPFSSKGSDVAVLGLPIGRTEFLWYVTVILLALVALFTSTLLNSRVGRAFAAIRDAEVHASALGVEAAKYRAIAFTLSSAYAGLGGALLAIIIQRVVPDYWGLWLSLSYLAMVVIGGMRSVVGAVLGAAFVTALPAVLQRYGESIPFVGSAGGTGIGPSVVAQVLYGASVIVILIFEPEGLVRIFARLVPRRFRRHDDAPPDVTDSVDGEPSVSQLTAGHPSAPSVPE